MSTGTSALHEYMLPPTPAMTPLPAATTINKQPFSSANYCDVDQRRRHTTTHPPTYHDVADVELQSPVVQYLIGLLVRLQRTDELFHL